jgi:hypothetical protein
MQGSDCRVKLRYSAFSGAGEDDADQPRRGRHRRLVNAIAVVGRQIGKAVAGLRKTNEDLATARWFETFRLTGTLLNLPGLSPASWPPSGHAMTQTGPSGRSWPASRRTGWSPAPWKPGGKPGWLTWPAPTPRWPPGAPPSPGCRPRTSSQPPSRTCPPMGPAPPPATRTASGCCAPCSPTSPSPPAPRTPPRSRSGALEIPGQPAGPGHPAQERDPAALHRPGRRRASQPHRARPGQHRPRRRAERCRAPHRHRAAIRRHHSREPAELPPHPLRGLLEDGELTPRQVAGRVGVSTGTVHYWIRSGDLAARRGPAGRWCIPFPPDVEQACRDRAASSAHQHRDTGQDRLALSTSAGSPRLCRALRWILGSS